MYFCRIAETYEILMHPMTFLNFFADTSYPYQASGFMALVQLVETHVDQEALIPLPRYSIHLLTAWHDYFRHPSDLSTDYNVNERVYVLIHPQNSHQAWFRLNVDFMDIHKCTETCGDCDFLDVRRINKVSDYSPENRWENEIGSSKIFTSSLS